MARWAAYTGVTLLVADDADALPQAALSDLARSGVTASLYPDIAEALVRIGCDDPDVILLSAGLPLPCAGVVAAVRSASTAPILIGAAIDETQTAGAALVAGGYALVRRPYHGDELLHLIDGMQELLEARRRPRSNLKYGPLELCSESFTVRMNGRELVLPLKEFELLRLLMSHPDRVVSVDDIRDTLWRPGSRLPSSNTVAVHVARLRARIGGQQVLRTVRGIGYRLTFPPAPEEPGLGS